MAMHRLYPYARWFTCVSVIGLAPLAIGQDEQPAFVVAVGDDTGEWANNNVCDDPRFEGAGVDDALAPEDVGRDATDCQLEFEAGLARLNPNFIAFGDDSGDWALDGVCDDPRFLREESDDIVLSEDVTRDASDCYSAYVLGKITANVVFE